MSVRKRVSAKSPVLENSTQGSVGGSPSNGWFYPHKNCIHIVIIVALVLTGANPILFAQNEKQNEKIKWFKDVKFGMFIHWAFTQCMEVYIKGKFLHVMLNG
ncbi:MAG: hypothetical protein U9O87_00885 [Verrucomicrobiota bacterium]|nr:hypothetical protein [Verrucomicrobiota bacterium]